MLFCFHYPSWKLMNNLKFWREFNFSFQFARQLKRVLSICRLLSVWFHVNAALPQGSGRCKFQKLSTRWVDSTEISKVCCTAKKKQNKKSWSLSTSPTGWLKEWNSDCSPCTTTHSSSLGSTDSAKWVEQWRFCFSTKHWTDSNLACWKSLLDWRYFTHCWHFYNSLTLAVSMLAL